MPGKILSKLPKHVFVELHLRITLVGEHGLEKVRKIHGYHHEPLPGTRSGQRSIRLTKTYRIEKDVVEFNPTSTKTADAAGMEP